MEPLTASLAERWQALKQTRPGLRIRDAAQQLGVSEVELLATQTGAGVTRLRLEIEPLLSRLPQLGRIMALTRNHAVVIEKEGVFNEPGFFRRTEDGPLTMGQVVGPEIDLRLFFGVWAFAYAVEQEIRGHTMRSLQFFSTQGEAILKVYPKNDEAKPVYQNLVDDFRDGEQAPPVVEPAVADDPQPLPDVDRALFLKEWSELQDTHDFFAMIRRYKLPRLDAVRIAEYMFSRRLHRAAVRDVLRNSAESGLPIMVFVGNPGCIEIHTGPVTTVKELDDWFNVLDPGFNLHIHEPSVHEYWMTIKPTKDGDVTAVEGYDRTGELVLQFFGERKPGRAEREEWRQLVHKIPDA